MVINPLGRLEEALTAMLVGKIIRFGRFRKPRRVIAAELEAESGGVDGEESYPTIYLRFDDSDLPGFWWTGDIEIIEDTDQ